MSPILEGCIMKAFILLLALLAAGSVKGQSDTDPLGQEFNTTFPKFADQTDLFKTELKPNQIAGPRRDITFSGIIPEAMKADYPLQLINPFAPPEYGYGEQNLSPDISIRHEPGLKFFSVDF